MSNTFGTLFKVTTFGESHSKAIGVVIDGCPAGVTLKNEEIESYISDNSNFSNYSTARRETNKIEILCGVYNSKTLGTPLTIITYNRDADSSRYFELEGIARPSHAEYTYFKKYGIYDPRGGGRASGRECISRHIAAAVAHKLLEQTAIKFDASIIELAGIKIENEKKMTAAVKRIEKLHNEKDSSGGVFEIIITGAPSGLGNPVFDKLSSQIGSFLFSIGGIKSVEIGMGKNIAGMRASEANDCAQYDETCRVFFLTNNSGGISGGISNGAPIIIRAAVKPVPSISRKQKTIDFYNCRNREIELAGRFDANFTPRAMSAAVSMIKIMIADNLLQMNYNFFKAGRSNNK